MTADDSRPNVVVVSEFQEMESEESFFEIFEDFCSGRYRLQQISTMDAYMTMLTPGCCAVILNIWLYSHLHQELIEKLHNELRVPVIVHLTDDRPEVRKSLDGQEGVLRMKKPASLHRMVDVIEAIRAGGDPRPFTVSEEAEG